MNCEAIVILVTLWAVVGICFSYKYYWDEMRDQNWYLSDVFSVIVILFVWPVVLLAFIVATIVNLDEIVIKRKK